MEGLLLFLRLISGSVGCFAFVKRRVPRRVVRRAPVGTVKIIDKTQVVNIFSAYTYSLLSGSTIVSATGPRAACKIVLWWSNEINPVGLF